MSGPPILWNFGKLESVLSRVNMIADEKRTAFQHRLKNFHRLNFPVGFELKQGRAATYEPGVVMMMALAVELTQLGLSPETIVRTLALNWYPTNMALRMSARSLADALTAQAGTGGEDVTPMFIFFDPMALSSLQAPEQPRLLDFGNSQRTSEGQGDNSDAVDQSFFYGGIGIIKENVARWTSGDSSRLSLVNVTTLMRRVVDSPFQTEEANIEYQVRFFGNIESWTDKIQAHIDGGHALFLHQWIKVCLAPLTANDTDIEEDVDFVIGHLGMRRDVVEKTIRELRGDE